MNWPQFLLGAYLFVLALLMCVFTGGGEAYKPSPMHEKSQS